MIVTVFYVVVKHYIDKKIGYENWFIYKNGFICINCYYERMEKKEKEKENT